jgi:hypothetical protein
VEGVKSRCSSHPQVLAPDNPLEKCLLFEEGFSSFLFASLSVSFVRVCLLLSLVTLLYVPHCLCEHSVSPKKKERGEAAQVLKV